ncbi:uncharacterized protein LOC136072547 [Hydra vulgaris]|uniref:uncharacterized protein LOC136072547 n=1 Tax=Hydra vulgaris TaxID=6087 RepID=UPI0032E9D508
MQKKKYYSHLINKHENNSKQIWKITKEITGKLKTNTNSLPHKIKIDSKLINDSNYIAAEFNKFFTTIGAKLANSILYIDDKSVEFQTSTSSSFHFTELTYDEFEIAFSSLKRNKTTGYDDINVNIIIDFCNVIKHIIFKIFRAPISQGMFPDCLKIAKVFPVYKTRDHTNINNYRPISVLSVFSKILENLKEVYSLLRVLLLRMRECKLF